MKDIPFAQKCQCNMGEGNVFHKGKLKPASTALEAIGLKPLVPKPKEGLSLINGTQVMTAIGMLVCFDTQTLIASADIATAMSVDATRGSATPFRPEIQTVRPHPGQQQTAANVRALLQDDAIRLSHVNCKKVQDPYSLRCVPQVHGAARGVLAHVREVLEVEANSSTDNPLVFAHEDEILSGGNFHGEPVAFALDYLALAVAEIANISERRIEKLVNPHLSGLPAFLATDSGLNSGYMIPHVVAAALVGENKVLSHPASVDSLPTSAEKEDHVSMGMSAALKLQTILRNSEFVLAIEFFAAAEALEFLLPLEGGIGVRAAHGWMRQHYPPMKKDRSLSEEFQSLAERIRLREIIDAVEKELQATLH